MRRSANRRQTGHQQPPQILSTEVVEQAREPWLSPANAANAPGDQVSGGGPLDTIPHDGTTDPRSGAVTRSEFRNSFHSPCVFSLRKAGLHAFICHAHI